MRTTAKTAIRAAVCCAAALAAGSVAAALEAAQPPLARPVPVFEGTIDLSAAPGSTENTASIDFLAKLPSAPEMIFLDLTIAPKVDEAGGLDFGAIAYGGPNGAALSPFPCTAGSWTMIDRGLSVLTVAPTALDTHLLLTIEAASGPAAPFNAMSCDYAPGLPAQVALHITGFFVVQETAIPTARGLRFVPYTPPYAEALDALARSIAAP